MKSNKFEFFKDRNLSFLLAIHFIIFWGVRIYCILNVDHSLQGDAVSRLANTYAMHDKFSFWPIQIWLPLPFWLLYLFSFMVDDWIIFPRVLPSLFVWVAHIFVFKLIDRKINRLAAFTTTIMLSLSIPHALMETHFLSEPFYYSLFIFSLYFYSQYQETGKKFVLWGLSISLALILLTRYEAFIFVFCFGLYTLFNKKISWSELIKIQSLPLLSSFYVFYMNYQFGGHILWGVTNSDKTLEKLWNLDFFNLEHVLWPIEEALSFGFLGVYLAGAGFLISLFKSKNDFTKSAFHIYCLLIISIVTYKLFTKTLVFDYRYHLLSSALINFYAVYFLFFRTFNNKIRIIIFSGLIGYFSYFQIQKFQMLARPEANFHPGLKATAAWIKENTNRKKAKVAIDRFSNIKDPHHWHTLGWTVLAERSKHSYETACIVYNFPYYDGGFDPKRFRGCFEHFKPNYIVLFRDGFLKKLYVNKESIFSDYKFEEVFENDGYIILKSL